LYLVVARIGRAHGVRGEVTVEVRTDLPEERFFIGARLRTDPESKGPLTIASVRDQSGTLILSFEQAKNREAAETLRNTLLLADVNPKDVNTSPNDFHISQIIDARVHDKNGVEIGRVVDVLALPAHDTLVIEVAGKEILIPFIKKYVPEVSIERREIKVDQWQEFQ
jgi:16S rRNA processing protein RimM